MDKRFVTPLVVAAGIFVLAGGYVHAREWWDVYRDLPSSVPGAAVVRIGFPVNAVVSLVVAGGLAIASRRLAGLTVAVAGALALQVASVAVLVLSSEGTFLGWTEPGYSQAAQQALAVEGGAVVCLVGALVLRRVVFAGRRQLATA